MDLSEHLEVRSEGRLDSRMEEWGWEGSYDEGVCGSCSGGL
jgi:hypothetical protein